MDESIIEYLSHESIFYVEEKKLKRVFEFCN